MTADGTCSGGGMTASGTCSGGAAAAGAIFLHAVMAGVCHLHSAGRIAAREEHPMGPGDIALGQAEHQKAIVEAGVRAFGVNTAGQPHRPLVGSVAPLVDDVVLLFLVWSAKLRPKVDSVAGHLDFDVVGVKPRHGCDEDNLFGGLEHIDGDGLRFLAAARAGLALDGVEMRHVFKHSIQEPPERNGSQEWIVVAYHR